MNIIEIHKLSKYYHRSRGIEDITLNVPQGSIFGFIGPNGAGKSTTIRILLNLIFPTSGSAKIFGMDVVKDSKKIRSRIGYIPSDANMYDRMTVDEFLKFGAAFYGVGNNNPRMQYLLELFDLDPMRKIHELSMGNKKKVSIIQALVHRPELLILDEPTSGLDPLIQSRFFALLLEENLNGTTIFFSSHVLSEVQTLCKTVAIIKDGKIINVENIASMRDKQLKKVRIVSDKEITIQDLGIDGIGPVESGMGKTLLFFFSGDINALIGSLTSQQIENLSIEEPPLEEIFLHYYK
ncbi:MAG: ABC transporter ATP-binding protein [Bacteroidetes bacterium]|nr:ABC transporter ATP-binding protein [Bacteroidota bacterium]